MRAKRYILLVAVLLLSVPAFWIGNRQKTLCAGNRPVFLKVNADEGFPKQQMEGCSSCNHAPYAGAIGSYWPDGIKLADIPESRFKEGLIALSPEGLSEALATLAAVNFRTNDLGSLRVDQQGGVFYVCMLSKSPADKITGAEATDEFQSSENEIVAFGESVPISSPPALHSRPGADKVLFLDFNGHVVSGTRWNSNTDYGPTPIWDCLPYSIDQDDENFSTAELVNITQIWKRVTEDFAPFNVDVTTEQPAFWNSETAHALITPPSDRDGRVCPHNGYGGIAYLDVFGEAIYSYNYSGEPRSPAWVNGTMSVASIAEATSHELGHNLGLSHDGSSANAYYRGHSNGGIRWAPIMGTGYDDDVTQWSRGEYSDANQTQDDLVILSGKLSYRPDDHGDNDSSASMLTTVGFGEVADSGVIETTGDPDVFTFQTIAGNVTIHAEAYRASSSTRGANLDIELELYNASGDLVAANNPELSVDASVSAMLTAGQYFLHVKPTGMGDPQASPPSGYTSYGSLGQYWLSGSVAADADGDSLPNQWELQYFGNITSAVASADSDGDGTDNLTEHVAGSDPLDRLSVFEIDAYKPPTGSNDPVIISWSTRPNRTYSVNYASNLGLSGFTPFSDARNLPHTVNSYTDSVQRAESLFFYRVDVKLAE